MAGDGTTYSGPMHPNLGPHKADGLVNLWFAVSMVVWSGVTKKSPFVATKQKKICKRACQAVVIWPNSVCWRPLDTIVRNWRVK